MVTLPPPPKTTEIFFCVTYFPIQYTDIQHWAVPMLQVILLHQQITRNLKCFPCAAAHTADCLIKDCDNNQWTECSIILHEQLTDFQLLKKTPKCPTMQAIIKYLHMSRNFDSVYTVPNLWIQGTERTMMTVLPSVVFTRHWLTDQIAGQNDVCTWLPLVLQQNTSETCSDLVQWNCFYPHKHKCSLYDFHCLLTEHKKTDIQRSVSRRERVMRPPRGGKMGGKMDICNVK
jgi:hypothetical protein